MLKVREIMHHILWGECLHELFGILLQWRLVSSPPFIDLLNNLFVTVQTRGYLFYALGSNSILLYLLLKFFWLQSLGTLLVSLTYSYQWIFLTFFFFLLFDTTRSSRLILHFTCPSPRINHLPHFLLSKYCIRNQDLGTGCVFC